MKCGPNANELGRCCENHAGFQHAASWPLWASRARRWLNKSVS